MQTLLSTLPVGINEDQSLLFKMLPIQLSNVPFHENTKSITRYFAEKFPVHIAVHEISPVINPPVEYTQPHLHDDTDEINIIISQRNLIYKIQLGGNEYEVSNNFCVWIPRGMMHAANVLKGSGYFITLRMK